MPLRNVSWKEGDPDNDSPRGEYILRGEASSSREDYILAEEPDSQQDNLEDNSALPVANRRSDRSQSSTSIIEETEHELELLVLRAEQNNPEYASIVANATRVEDVSCDVWGASIWILVHDLPDFRAGRMLFEGQCRLAFVSFVFVINFLIQSILLYFIITLLMMPGLLETQNIYKKFHKEAFIDAAVNSDRFDAMSSRDKANLCGLALSQLMFVRVILFLWVTLNVGELRDCFTKMLGAFSLPDLPEGLDTRLMKRDLAASNNVHNIICLNMKGKIGLTIVVFIPKMIIALVLMLTGCIWLMAAENIGDLILNSLALAFVVKVDELLAAVFFPEHFLEEVQDLAFVLPADANDKDEASIERAWEFAMCALTLLATLGAVEVIICFQPVLPKYSYDVPGACMAYLAGQVPWCGPFQTDCFPRG